MRPLIAAIFLAACSAQTPSANPVTSPPTAPASDRAGARLEALMACGEESCTEDGLWRLDASGLITYGADNTQRATTDAVDEAEERAVWPFIIRFGEAALVGVMFTRSESYSGGGGAQSIITLYEVEAASFEARPVISLPLSGSVSIRACFNEQDRGARRNACSDEYRFAGALTLDETNAETRPRLVFTTRAATYPGARSRMQDSTALPPLQQGDLVWAFDERCSYRRVLAWSEGAGAYAPDQALPDRSD